MDTHPYLKGRDELKLEGVEVVGRRGGGEEVEEVKHEVGERC